jgi:hypothetical protein
VRAKISSRLQENWLLTVLEYNIPEPELQQLELLCVAALQTEDRSIDRSLQEGGEFKILSSETCGIVEHDIPLLLLENVAGHVRTCRPRNLLYSSRIVTDRGEKIVDLLISVSVVDLIINFLGSFFVGLA